MKKLVFALLGWAMAAQAALPPAPAPIAVTADETATLATEPVVRLEATSAGSYTVGIVDVAAPPGRAFDAVMDLPPRVAESSNLKSVVVYRREPPQNGQPEIMGARFTLKVLTSTLVFHILYEIDRANGWCVYRLDPSQPNDLVLVDGSYHVYASGSGSRIVNRARSESGTAVPEWLKRSLANGPLKEQLRGIRDRAQRR